MKRDQISAVTPITRAISAAAALIALVLGVTALIWSRFTYQVTSKEIRIKSGLLNRNNRSIPFDRIQDVSLEQKLVSRLLGLATSDAEDMRETIKGHIRQDMI